MPSTKVNIFTINILSLAFLASIFIQKSHVGYPWHSLGMLVFKACLTATAIISSYHVGKVLFETSNSQILSVGFIFTSVEFIIFSLFIVGYNSIIREFSYPSFFINITVFVIIFLIVPIFAAKPVNFLLRLVNGKKV